MIIYDNRSIRSILFRRSGSVLFSGKVLFPATCSTVVGILILCYPEIKAYANVPGSLVVIYATILGFGIVTRTNMAFSRYFEGVANVQVMFSTWRHACASLNVFIEASAKQHEEAGALDVVSELWASKGKLLHWFSLLSALGVQRLKGEETGLEDIKEIEVLENRAIVWPDPSKLSAFDSVQRAMSTQKAALSTARRSSLSSSTSVVLGPASGRAEPLMKTALEVFGSGVPVLGKTSKDEQEQLAKAHDDMLTLLRWIMTEISGHSISKALLIPEPILSRVYQDLGVGMYHFTMAMKVSWVPFPFPFDQVIQYLLLAFFVVCPFAMLEHLPDPVPGINLTWCALPLNFLACAGFNALNEIAVELEEPFGDKINCYPVQQQHWNAVWLHEQGFFTATPRNFTMQNLGSDSAKLEREVLAKVEDMSNVLGKSGGSSAPGAKIPEQAPAQKPMDHPLPEVAALVPKFKALNETTLESVWRLQRLGQSRCEELSLLDERLQVALRCLAGSGEGAGAEVDGFFEPTDLTDFLGVWDQEDDNELRSLLQTQNTITERLRQISATAKLHGSDASLGISI